MNDDCSIIGERSSKMSINAYQYSVKNFETTHSENQAEELTELKTENKEKNYPNAFWY